MRGPQPQAEGWVEQRPVVSTEAGEATQARRAKTARVSVGAQRMREVAVVEARTGARGDEAADASQDGRASGECQARPVAGTLRRPRRRVDAEELVGETECHSWPWNRAAEREAAVSDWAPAEEAGRGAESTGAGRADV